MYNYKKSIKALGNLFRNAIVLKTEKLKSDTKFGISERFIEVFPEDNSEDVLEMLAVPLLWPNLSEEEMIDTFYESLKIREIAVKSLAESNQRV